MRITWFAHASFLIEGDGRRIITDPYNPDVMGFAPITQPADMVIRSSADDRGHNHAVMIPGDPLVVTATDLVAAGGGIAAGLAIRVAGVQESLVHKDSPLDNAMYRFTVDGVDLAHMGDAGNRLTDQQIGILAGCDVLLALAGGPPTIEIPDLLDAIKAIGPKVVIPMHYALPGSAMKMLQVQELTRHFPGAATRQLGASSVELTSDALPEQTTVFVLTPTTAGGTTAPGLE